MIFRQVPDLLDSIDDSIDLIVILLVVFVKCFSYKTIELSLLHGAMCSDCIHVAITSK